MLIAAFTQYFFGIAIFMTSMFLVLLVLVQRGRGGGLTGALGGPGGQSAFGTKAGDLFTRITIGVAAAWIFLCAAAVVSLKSRGLPTISGNNTSANSGNLGIGGTTDNSNTSGLTGDAGGTVSSTASPALPTIDVTGTGSPTDPQAEITDLPEETSPNTTPQNDGSDSAASENSGSDDGSQ